METMQLIQTDTSDLTLLSDSDLEAFFAYLELDIEVVGHCDEATCRVCRSGETVRAA